MSPETAIEPITMPNLKLLFRSALVNGSVFSDIIYILSPSVKATSDKSHTCQSALFTLYLISLVNVPFFTPLIVLSPVEVKHK